MSNECSRTDSQNHALEEDEWVVVLPEKNTRRMTMEASTSATSTSSKPVQVFLLMGESIMGGMGKVRYDTRGSTHRYRMYFSLTHSCVWGLSFYCRSREMAKMPEEEEEKAR
jgi:hypothetical protein